MTTPGLRMMRRRQRTSLAVAKLDATSPSGRPPTPQAAKP